jgi:hypothetical protein
LGLQAQIPNKLTQITTVAAHGAFVASGEVDEIDEDLYLWKTIAKRFRYKSFEINQIQYRLGYYQEIFN